MQIQVVDYDSFFGLHRILPHILPGIKIRITEGISRSALDLIKGCRPHGAGACVLGYRFILLVGGGVGVEFCRK